MTRRNLSIAMILMVGLLLASAGAFAKGPPSVSPAVCGDLVSGSVCDAELAALCAATEGAESLKDRDRDALVGKVVEASIKLSQGKTGDAEQKLGDFEAKLTALIEAAKPKISEEDANAISPLLVAAQICVATIE